MKLKKLALAAALTCATMSAQAGIINGDFSDGLNGWDVSLANLGQVGVFGESLFMTSDASVGQSLSWLQGDEISFDFLLDFTEEQNATIPFNDFALFWLTDQFDNLLTLVTIGDVLNHPNTTQKFTHVFDSTENGTFNIGIYDQFDNARNSRMMVDNVVFEGATVDVPEPTSAAILALGLVGMGAAFRRRNAKI